MDVFIVPQKKDEKYYIHWAYEHITSDSTVCTIVYTSAHKAFILQRKGIIYHGNNIDMRMNEMKK